MYNELAPQHSPIKAFGHTYLYHDTFSSKTDADLLKTIENYKKAGHQTMVKKNKQDSNCADLYVRQDNTRNQ